MKKIALITGATSGIGKSTAHYLADQFYLIICGRRKDKLEELAHNLRTETDVHILSFDVRDQRAVNEGSTKDWDDMIDINVKGLLYVSKAVIPGMVEKKSGFIVNIGSIAGKEVYPKGNVYCASKHAVDAITNGMRLDLNPYGIRVTGIHPGLVETEFSLVRFKGDEEKAKQTYKGMKPLTGDDVADVIKYVVTRPPHVLLSDIVLFPTAQASATMVHRES
jgi:3-hydroxy acid dehydrogenase / malonic semialdehyde reductase